MSSFHTSGGIQLFRGVVCTCPHCRTNTLIRTSRLLTTTFREVWAWCPNCSFAGVLAASWEKELAPSLLPNPEVRLHIAHRSQAVEAFMAAISTESDQLTLFNPEATALEPPTAGICIDSG